MKKVAEKPRYVWVKRIGRGWFPYVELVEQVTMPLGFVVVIVSLLFGFGEVATMIGAGMIALSFLLLLPLNYSLYNMLVALSAGTTRCGPAKHTRRSPTGQHFERPQTWRSAPSVTNEARDRSQDARTNALGHWLSNEGLLGNDKP